MSKTLLAGLLPGAALIAAGPANAQTVQELQRQIDALRAEIAAMKAERAARSAAAPVPAPAAIAQSTPAAPTPTPAAPALAIATATPVATAAAPKSKPWFERFQLRGYTQLRFNEFISGDRTAIAPRPRLRSPHDSSISEDGNFTLRRVRLVLQGNITDDLQLYLQQDFGSAVNGQSNGERREHFGQLRDAYVDAFIDKGHEFKLRFGQSKVPFGWENLQSSSNRLTIDRSDGINSAIPGERDLGIVAYYTPRRVQRIWDRLAKGGQKLFGNYGAFGLALYNGQGVNRPERNQGLMKVAMATWPFELDGLGLPGQVLELGGSAMLNQVRPEVRTGGVSAANFDDNRVGVHMILYPQPFGLQAEWNWGEGPEFDRALGAITTRRLNGGYVQAMVDLGESPIGHLMPYGRWQRYRGGWKAATNAPRLETDEFELGVEWRFMSALEFTLAYANMTRSDTDERRLGRARGDLIRTQLQFSY